MPLATRAQLVNAGDIIEGLCHVRYVLDALAYGFWAILDSSGLLVEL